MINWYAKPPDGTSPIPAAVQLAFSQGFAVSRVGVLFLNRYFRVFVEHAFWARLMFPEKCSQSIQALAVEISSIVGPSKQVIIEDQCDAKREMQGISGSRSSRG